MADKSVDLTTDNIIYAAEASYWGTAAQKEMYETMCQYVQIIEQLTKVLQDKYDDGYISKTDLIQMQTRLKEAELQRSSSYQSYQVALQNMNVLMGLEPLAEMDLTDSISTILPMPALLSGNSLECASRLCYLTVGCGLSEKTGKSGCRQVQSFSFYRF